MNDDFSTLFDFLPIGAYRSLPEGRQLRANPALVALNGYTSEAEQIAAVHDIATEWYVEPRRRAQFLQILERDGYVRGFVSEVYRYKSRERIWVGENAHAVRDGQGRLRYIEGTIEDVTERVRAEEALRESEERWKLALDSSGDGVWEWNLETGEESYSPRFAEMYGFAPGEIERLSESFVSRVHPDDEAQRRAHRDAHLAGHTPRYVSEHRVRCKDGSWKWVLARGMVIKRDAQGRPVRMIVTHTDITTAKDAEELRRARDQAESADRAKTELLSHVSHELRTPLNGVLGFAQLLEQAEDLPPQYQPWVARILSSGRHLLGVVDDLLDLSSAQSGGMRLAFATLDPVGVLHDAWSMLAERAREAGVSYQPCKPNGADLAVVADRQRLRQVFANLLSNAIKYNRPGGQVEVSAARTGERIELQIVDTGLGMSDAQLERIFRPFERLGVEGSSIPGTGLGLALSRQLVEAMGGEIRVASARGRGTTFTVALRAAH
jgi:PAS domain S-box-containing protein